MVLLMVMISPRVIVYVRRFETVERPLFFSTFNYLFFFCCSHSLFFCWFFLRVLWTSNFGLLSAITSVPVREGNAIPH
ncbi:hypothetical protein BDV40DRAFT_197687 [Aspergillus tamarii]|uniref:Uncharacterized protein n=1 Tax=Aspergillus tamarii TaxID=41984 RepID=A0A5N6UR28_ASPTM|nr:hypothetical protein BDV40DRAFT_197687 [Aspergillus tamarii]